MATKGGSKMFWIIGGLIVVAGSIGAYFLLRKPKEDETGETDTDTNTDAGSGSETGSGSGSGSITYTAPAELGDSTKIKAFQDWMDANHPCWILDSDGKYKNLSKNVGKCNRNIGGKGYGNYGGKTDGVWKLFGAEYLSKKVDTDKPVKNTTSNKDIELIIKEATGSIADKSVLEKKPASWVKDWANAIRDKRTTFFWTKSEGGNNKTYKVSNGSVLLNYIPVGNVYYASKSGLLAKSEPKNSASAINLTQGENLGKAGDVTYDGNSVFIYFPNKQGGGYSKWIYESAITSKKPSSSFSGITDEIEFANFNNNFDLNL